MRPLLQPPGSNLCGQTCVAMLCGLTIEQAVLLVGTAGCTKAKDLVRAVTKHGGILIAPPCLRLRQEEPLPRNAILNMHWRSRSKGHWMLRYKGTTYDPAGGSLDTDGRPVWGNVTSYLPFAQL